jgi:predicted N-acyltransferase
MPEFAADTLRLEAAEDIDGVTPGVWDSLMDECDASVFYRHSFLSAYQHGNLGSAVATRYLLCSRAADGGEPTLVGALPAYLVDGAEVGRVLGIERLASASRPLLMSHLPHCYDTTIPAAGADPDVVLRLWDGFCELGRSLGAGVAGLLNVAADDATLVLLEAARQVTRLPGASRWQLDMVASVGFDAHLATMSRSTRRTLRSAIARAERAGVVCESEAYPRSRARERLGDVIELCVSTAERHGSAYYPREPLARFLADLDEFEVLRVRRGSETLAASICLRERGTLHTWAGGAYYPADVNWSPNHLLFAAEIRHAFDSGARLLECGRRNDVFKLRHRLRRKELALCLEFLE